MEIMSEDRKTVGFRNATAATCTRWNRQYLSGNKGAAIALGLLAAGNAACWWNLTAWAAAPLTIGTLLGLRDYVKCKYDSQTKRVAGAALTGVLVTTIATFCSWLIYNDHNITEQNKLRGAAEKPFEQTCWRAGNSFPVKHKDNIYTFKIEGLSEKKVVSFSAEAPNGNLSKHELTAVASTTVHRKKFWTGEPEPEQLHVFATRQGPYNPEAPCPQ